MENKHEAYNQALDKIYSFIDYSMTHTAEISSAVFSLSKITNLLSALGDPQKKYPTVHIAGTKGKGSVCAMLDSVLRETGAKVGLYTSPHLIQFNERFQINGNMIEDKEIIRLTEMITSAINLECPPSSFDIMTAMAFYWFAENNVDIAIIETGLGGRLDSTNVITPILSVITPISIDHTAFLGNTIEEIAREKGGIIKPHTPVILATQRPEAREILSKIACKQNAEIIFADEQIHIKNLVSSRNNQIFDFSVSDSYEKTRITLPLAGAHQIQNTQTALAALTKLKSFGYTIKECSIIKGLEKVRWMCRFETVSERPHIILDGAHNTESIQKIAEALHELYDGWDIVCIFGCSEDKDIDAMIQTLSALPVTFIATQSIHPRAMKPERIAQCAAQYGRNTSIAATLEKALSTAQAQVKNEKTLIMGTGSLFIAGGLRELLFAKGSEDKNNETQENL